MIILVLLFTYFFCSTQSNRISFIFNFHKIISNHSEKKVIICWENSFKIFTSSHLWNYLKYKFENILFEPHGDLIWINLYFSIFFNLETSLVKNTFYFNLYLANFFICHNSIEYIMDSSLIDHSLINEKNSIDFSMDLFGFYNHIRYEPGKSFLVTDCISRVYQDTISSVAYKNKSNHGENFLFFKIFKKISFSKKDENQIIFISNFDLKVKLLEIYFFPSTNIKKYFFTKKNSSSSQKIIHFKRLLNPNYLYTFYTKNLFSSEQIIENSSILYWYCKFFFTKHRFVHIIFMLIFYFSVFNKQKIGKKNPVILLKNLMLILNFEIFEKCLSKFVQIIIERKNSLNTLFSLRIFYVLLFLFINFSKNLFKKYYLFLKIKQPVKWLMNFRFNIQHSIIKIRKRKLFIFKNPKIFILFDYVKKLSSISNLHPEKETKSYLLILEFVGREKIVSLLIYIFSALKEKQLFNHTIEIIRKKIENFQLIIKIKAYRFMIIKILIKSNLKRLNIGKISVLENLISLRLVNINYFPRTIFEKQLMKNFSLDLGGETTLFFLSRISNWKKATRMDKTSLQVFLKLSKKKEQKLALKTLFKVKKTNQLFNNGILNFCSNYLEAVSFFISSQIHEIIWLGYFDLKKSRLENNITKIIHNQSFSHLYAKKSRSSLIKQII